MDAAHVKACGEAGLSTCFECAQEEHPEQIEKVLTEQAAQTAAEQAAPEVTEANARISRELLERFKNTGYSERVRTMRELRKNLRRGTVGEQLLAQLGEACSTCKSRKGKATKAATQYLQAREPRIVLESAMATAKREEPQRQKAREASQRRR